MSPKDHKLPLSSSAVSAPTSLPPQPPLSPSKRVLIVDDNHDAAEILAEALTIMGHETRFAHDGPSALRVAAEFAPEVALLDIGLPLMDGYELALRLRALPGLSQVRLVALTGFGQERDRERSRSSGFEQHLLKPVDLEGVRLLIERA